MAASLRRRAGQRHRGKGCHQPSARPGTLAPHQLLHALRTLESGGNPRNTRSGRPVCSVLTTARSSLQGRNMPLDGPRDPRCCEQEAVQRAECRKGVKSPRGLTCAAMSAAGGLIQRPVLP